MSQPSKSAESTTISSYLSEPLAVGEPAPAGR